MKSFEYLGPVGKDDPPGLHHAAFARRKLEWLIEQVYASAKEWGTSDEEVAARIAMFRQEIEEHDRQWDPIRAREKELLAAGVTTGATLPCPMCAEFADRGASRCMRCRLVCQ